MRRNRMCLALFTAIVGVFLTGGLPAEVNQEEGRWTTLEKGVLLVRERYRPALVLFDDADALELDAMIEGSTSLRKITEKFVTIRVDAKKLNQKYPNLPTGPVIPPKRGARDRQRPAPKPDAIPPGKTTVSQHLRILSGDASLVVLDYRERVVARFDRELPARTKLSSRLRQVIKANDYYAKQARGIEKMLIDASKAYRAGNTRVAVQKVAPLESKSALRKMDPTLKGWVAQQIGEYRKKAEELLGKAHELEREGDKRRADSGQKYDKAMQAFVKVARDFPFKDVAIKANRRRGEILRKMTLTGENPFK